MRLGKRAGTRNFHSLRTTLLLYFTGITVLGLVIIGVTINSLVGRRLQSSYLKSISGQVVTTGTILNANLTSVLQSVIGLAGDVHDGVLMNVLLGDNKPLSGESYLKLSTEADNIRTNQYDLIQSVYLSAGTAATVSSSDYYPKVDPQNQWMPATGKVVWKNLHPDSVYQEPGSVLSVAYGFSVPTPTGSTGGGVLFNLRQSFFDNLLKTYVSQNGYMVLVSPTTTMATNNVDANFRIDGAALTKLRTANSQSGNFVEANHSGTKLYLAYYRLPVNGWLLTAVVPQGDVAQRSDAITLLIVALLIALFIGLFVGSFILTRLITRPLEQLAAQVSSMSDDNLTISIQNVRNNEIGVVHQAIHHATERIRQLIEQVRQEEKTKHALRLAVMQAQINPHFLYNTLYSIEQLCELEGAQNASEMVSALSTYFRSSLSRGRDVITLGEELDHVKSYLQIQEMRYGDILSYQISVDEDLVGCQIVKLTLQPVVENAIYHGIKLKPEGGTIKVSASRSGDDVIVEVRDTGIGMTPRRLAEISQILASNVDETRQSFGLVNVHRRIRMHFGGQYGLNLESEVGTGTTVKVRLPYDDASMRDGAEDGIDDTV